MINCKSIICIVYSYLLYRKELGYYLETILKFQFLYDVPSIPLAIAIKEWRHRWLPFDWNFYFTPTSHSIESSVTALIFLLNHPQIYYLSIVHSIPSLILHFLFHSSLHDFNLWVLILLIISYNYFHYPSSSWCFVCKHCLRLGHWQQQIRCVAISRGRMTHPV